MNRLPAMMLVPLLLAGIVPTAAADPEVPGDSFPDIDGSAHAHAIEVIAAAGIVEGFDDGRFGPNDPVTRGQVSTMLTRAHPFPAGASTGFSDTEGSTHEHAIRDLVAAGVARGFPDGTFRPHDPVTRGQMASFLARTFPLPASTSVRASDIVGTTHLDAINAITEAGIAQGYRDGTFRPSRHVGRGELATFLARALELTDRIAPPPVWVAPEDDPDDPAGWDRDADAEVIAAHVDRLHDLFVVHSGTAMEALAAAQWPPIPATELAACLWEDAFPGFATLDAAAYTVMTSWADLVPDPGWSIAGYGRPADHGLRVYLAEYATTETATGAEPLFTSGTAHVGIDADGRVVEFLDCDEYL